MTNEETLEDKRKRLVKVLSNNVNSGNVTEIIKAVEDFVDEKIRVALEEYANADKDDFLADGGGF